MSISTSRTLAVNKRQERNAILIAALIACAHFSAGIYYLYLGWISGSVPFYALGGISLALGVFVGIGGVLYRRGQHDQGVLLALIPMVVSFPLFAILVSGLGWVTGLGLLVIASLIGIQSPQPQRLSLTLMIAARVSGFITILLDIFGSAARPSLWGIALQIAAASLIGALGFIIAQQLWTSGRIQNRIIVIQSAVLLPIIAIFAWYNVQIQRNDLEKELIKKAESTAISGAATIGYLFEEAIANGDLTTEQVFDAKYVLYWEFDPAIYQFDGDPATLNKYHTAYDAYTDKQWQKLLDSFLNQNDFVYAVAVDINGYVPTHNTRWSSWDGSPATDRSKRIFNDSTGTQAARNTQPTLVQIYQRPGTNETLLDVSAPIYVNGKHWGGFRVGSVLAQNNLTVQSIVQSSTMRILLASFFLIISLVVTSAWFLGRYVSAPLEKLTEEASRFSRGQFDEVVNIPNHAEVTILANAFNDMAAHTSDLLKTLEQRVAERTSEMEQVVKQSEKRASELQTIAEVARYISTEKGLENLLPLITRTVSEQFGFYHVGIFLLDENKKFAVLRAANSPGGQVMLERQHKLEVGQTGIVGNATSTGVPRIALDTGADSVYFNNPDLPNTHSEMALPLLARGEVIGALDVQSTEANAFTTSDISTLSLLADQIAIAIENARLLEESKKALVESESVFQEYIAQAWQSKSASNIMGYYQTMTGGKVITRKAAQEMGSLPGEEKITLAIPIQLRGQTIGTLNIRLNKSGEQLTTEQINIVQSVTERLGLALENARLFEETSTRASRERLVTEITTRIRETNDPQEMIKTAMEELKRALGASRIEVVPTKKATHLQDK